MAILKQPEPRPEIDEEEELMNAFAKALAPLMHRVLIPLLVCPYQRRYD